MQTSDLYSGKSPRYDPEVIQSQLCFELLNSKREVHQINHLEERGTLALLVSTNLKMLASLHKQTHLNQTHIAIRKTFQD